MRTRALRRRPPLSLATVLAVALSLDASSWTQPAGTLPGRLSAREFWALSESLSEAHGVFPNDNLISTELGFQKVMPALVGRAPEGGVYLGVGPEQNFTYIAALRPRMAFILDIRRGNRDVHLLHKALFELAADRAEYLSLLFSRPRPAEVTTSSTVEELFNGIEREKPSESLFAANLARVRDRLLETHQLPLSADELRWIEFAYRSFFRFGPTLTQFSPREPNEFTRMLTGNYRLLMQATDADGQARGYLSSEARFSFVKDLQARNLIIPVVGDFAGPKAVRAMADWLRARQAVVSAFYLSNVEDYLRRSLARNGTWREFCLNAATLPIDERSQFIRSSSLSPVIGRGRAVRGIPSKDPTRKTVTVVYSNGTTREMPQDEAVKEITGITEAPPNRLGRIAEDLEPCRR
jgi:hypothetical protein